MKKDKLVEDVNAFVEFFSKASNFPSKYEILEEGECLIIDFGGFGFSVGYEYLHYVEEYSVEELTGDYTVWVATYDPGSYWEPPSSDYCDVESFKTLGEALKKVYNLHMEDVWNAYCDNEYAKFFLD